MEQGNRQISLQSELFKKTAILHGAIGRAIILLRFLQFGAFCIGTDGLMNDLRLIEDEDFLVRIAEHVASHVFCQLMDRIVKFDHLSFGELLPKILELIPVFFAQLDLRAGVPLFEVADTILGYHSLMLDFRVELQESLIARHSFPIQRHFSFKVAIKIDDFMLPQVIDDFISGLLWIQLWIGLLLGLDFQFYHFVCKFVMIQLDWRIRVDLAHQLGREVFFVIANQK